MSGADTFTESVFTMRKMEDFVSISSTAACPLGGQRRLGEGGGIFLARVRGRYQKRTPYHAPERRLRTKLLPMFRSIPSVLQLKEQAQ